MIYLYNILKPKGKAHIWKGQDTECFMWSTGGLKQNREGWELNENLSNRDICHMCKQNSGDIEIIRTDITRN